MAAEHKRSNTSVAQTASKAGRGENRRPFLDDRRVESVTHKRFQAMADRYAAQQHDETPLKNREADINRMPGHTSVSFPHHVVQGAWAVLQQQTNVTPEEVQVVNDGPIPKVPTGIGNARQANYPQAVRHVGYGNLSGNSGTIHTEGKGGVRVDRQNPAQGFANIQAQANNPTTDLQYAPNTNNAQKGTTLGTVLVDNRLLRIDNQFANHQKYVQRVFCREMLNSWAQRTKKKIKKV